jgi:hypothetical protein
LLGAVLLIVGILGFFTGTHVLCFGINPAHNIVHILSGLLGLWAGFSGVKNSKIYCILFGLVYGLVTLLGFMNVEPVVRLLNLNQADNFLHLGIAAACLFMGITAKSSMTS